MKIKINKRKFKHTRDSKIIIIKPNLLGNHNFFDSSRVYSFQKGRNFVSFRTGSGVADLCLLREFRLLVVSKDSVYVCDGLIELFSTRNVSTET